MKSALYTGWVQHRRLWPREHRFRYRVYQLFLMLDEVCPIDEVDEVDQLDQLDQINRLDRIDDPGQLGEARERERDRGQPAANTVPPAPPLGDSWLFSIDRPNLVSFYRCDHLGDPAVPLDRAVRDLVEARTGERPRGRIGLLTHPRYFGYVMNPVSFFYCFAPTATASDPVVETIVAEVHNTPWGERHCYVLGEPENLGSTHHKQFVFAKAFHVSPFMAMEQTYDWRFTTPDAQLTVHMKNHPTTPADRADQDPGQRAIADPNAATTAAATTTAATTAAATTAASSAATTGDTTHAHVFDATMRLDRAPLTAATLRAALLHSPFMTGKVIAAIYWQALRLWLKRVPFHDHPRSSGATP